MESLYVLLILLAAFIASFIVAVAGAIQSKYFNFSIPPGVNQPGKLRLFYVLMRSASVLVSYSAVTSDTNMLQGLFL